MIKITVSILLLLSFFSCVFADSEHLESLLLKAKTNSEIEKLLSAHKDELSIDFQKQLISSGNKKRDEGDYMTAISLYEIAAKIAERIGMPTGVVDSWIEMATTYDSQGKGAERLQYAQQSLERSKELNYEVGTANALFQIADIQEIQGKYTEAKSSAEQALAIYEKIGDKEGMGACWNTIGLLFEDQGHYDQAQQAFEKALALRKETGNPRSIGTTLNDIAINFYSQGRLSEGIPYSEQALEQFRSVGDKKRTAIITFNLGTVYYNWGDLRAALRNYLEAVRLTEELHTEQHLNYMLLGIGVVYRNFGNYEEALRYDQRGLELSEKNNDQRGIADGYCHIGAVYSEEGNYSLAANFTKKCIDVRQAANMKDNIPDAFGDLGNIYLRQGNEEAAQRYFQEGLQMSEALNQQQNIPKILNMQGYAHFVAGNLELAAANYHDALEKSRALKDKVSAASTLRNLGYLYLAQHNFQQASASLQESLNLWQEIDSKPQTADAFLGLADLYYEEADYQKALEDSDKSLNIATQTDTPEVAWQALTTLGKSQRMLHRNDQARSCFDRAIQVIDSLRMNVAGSEEERQRFFEDKLAPYDQLVSLLYEENKLDEALFYAERAKARVLDDVLEKGKMEITGAMTPAERLQERQLIQDLVSLNTQIRSERIKQHPDSKLLSQLNDQLAKVRSNYEEFRVALYDAHPELKVQQAISEPQKGNDFEEVMGRHEAFLEYMVMDDRILLFVIRKSVENREQLKVYTMEIPRSELAKQVEQFHKQLSERDPDFLPTAQTLYQELVRPAEADLAKDTDVVIVPDRELWGLPFQAIANANGSYLIERFAISLAPSLRALQDLERSQTTSTQASVSTPKRERLLAFGNPMIAPSVSQRAAPVYRDQSLHSLPETETEVRFLQRLYGTRESRIYTGESASEARLKHEAPDFDILHLATHGILDSASPMYSHIVLSHPASESSEDGLLEAWEIMQMNLRADLVVLSACETALGRIGAGEGMIGLSWAFLVAGSKSLLVSQWKVESESTAQLMVSFYKNLRKGKTKAESLRLAAQALSRNPQYRHPFYWAGFVLIGESN